MTTYIIVDGDGNQLGGISTSETEIARIAQAKANDLGESVYYTTSDESGEPTEVEPEVVEDDLVVVETMPEWLRASHAAARNSGVYPHNGATRVAVDAETAAEMVQSDPDWTSIVRGESATGYDRG